MQRGPYASLPVQPPISLVVAVASGLPNGSFSHLQEDGLEQATSLQVEPSRLSVHSRHWKTQIATTLGNMSRLGGAQRPKVSSRQNSNRSSCRRSRLRCAQPCVVNPLLPKEKIKLQDPCGHSPAGFVSCTLTPPVQKKTKLLALLKLKDGKAHNSNSLYVPDEVKKTQKTTRGPETKLRLNTYKVSQRGFHYRTQTEMWESWQNYLLNETQTWNHPSRKSSIFPFTWAM